MSAWAGCRASPSLALLKYWGKLETGDNLPATPSLAVTLGGLYTDTWVRSAQDDSISIRGDAASHEPTRRGGERTTRFFDCLRSHLGVTKHFEARSVNSFPTAAGLASSSSGFAALTGACVTAAERELPPQELSEIARIGSVSAARSIYGGFVLLPAGALSAHQVFDARHWPDLRIVVVITHKGPKPESSRKAMRDTSATSPFYPQWVTESNTMLSEALSALRDRDLEKLGDIARSSYSMMHAAMLAARPPILYWLPATLAVIRACQELRSRGIGAWETIDAGPQVKILCAARDSETVAQRVGECVPEGETLTCFPGEGVSLSTVEEPGA